MHKMLNVVLNQMTILMILPDKRHPHTTYMLPSFLARYNYLHDKDTKLKILDIQEDFPLKQY